LCNNAKKQTKDNYHIHPSQRASTEERKVSHDRPYLSLETHMGILLMCNGYRDFLFKSEGIIWLLCVSIDCLTDVKLSSSFYRVVVQMICILSHWPSKLCNKQI